LERPDAGSVSIDGEIVSSKDVFTTTDKRNIGMVFQSYAIWPHMDVFSNVAFPLRVNREKYTKKEIEEKVLHALHVVELNGLAKRPAPKLSGGQQQRLALARALVRQPKLLLLDEPLSNLDASLRENMRVELRNLQQRLGITTIYVTHDQLEALALSDIIAVMRNGVIEQLGSPEDIYKKPVSKFIAGFIGNTNWLEGEVVGVEGMIVKAETVLGVISAMKAQECKVGDKIMLSIRPEAITVGKTVPESAQYCQARVENAMFLGEYIDSYLCIGDKRLRAKVHPDVKVKPGDLVCVQIAAEYCVALTS
jgi:iron(III) transport system ATP-binding protein